MVSNPGSSRLGSQVWCFAGARVDLVDETFPVRAGKAVGCHLCSIGVLFEPFLTHRTCVSALKCTPGSSGASSAARSYGESMWLPGRAARSTNVASMITASARDARFRSVMLDLTANPGQKIIVGYENGNGSSHRAQVQRDRDRNTA